jgi:hypothetical protein
LVLEAFDTLFNKRDYVAAARYWSPDYIQHSAHIEPGRDGLFNLIKSNPPTLKYEHDMIVSEDDFVIVHGRFRVLLSNRRRRGRISRLLHKYGLIAVGRRDNQIAARILDRHFICLYDCS